jgi:hypothetical protein
MKTAAGNVVVLLSRRLVVAVYDPKWFMEVVERLRRRGLPFSFYYTVEELPEYSVVYTDSYEILRELDSRRDLTIVYDPEKTCRGLEKAVLNAMFREEYTLLTIGIDPGLTHAYIALGDSTLLGWGFAEQVVEKVRELVECIPAKSKVVRVGGYSRGLEIAKEIKDNLKDIRVEIVSEYNTTPSHSRGVDGLYRGLRSILARQPYLKRNKDIIAALKISLKQGVEVV